MDKRRRFVCGHGLSSLWFVIFVLLAAYAHEFMRHHIVPGLSVAYLLALSQYVMIWGVTAAYLRSTRRRVLIRCAAKVVASRAARCTGAAAMNTTRLLFFAAILAITIGITVWASRRRARR